MHRTNIYLSDEQERKLDARAKANRMSRSAYVRRIIDQALEEPEPLASEVRDLLVEFADSYHELSDRVFGGDPDLRIDR